MQRSITDFLSSLWKQAITVLIFSGVSSLAFALWAKAEEADGFVIGLVALAAFALATLAIERVWSLLREANRQTPTAHTIESQTKDWLFRYGYSLRDTRNEAFAFAYHVEDPQKRVFAVGMPTDDPDFVLLTVTLNASPTQQGFINDVMSDPKLSVLQDLRIEFARLGVLYQGLVTPFTGVGLAIRLHRDSAMQKDVFFDRVTSMICAQVVFTETLAKAIRLAGRWDEIEATLELTPQTTTPPSADKP